MITPSEKFPVYTCMAHSADHTPLALGMLVSYLDAYRDGALRDRYHVLPRALYSPEQATAAVQKHGPGIFLFSDYLWSVDGNLAIASQVAELGGIVMAVHGGPSAPSYEGTCREFFSSHAHVDVTVRGEGEITTAEILALLAERGELADRTSLSDVAGITFRAAAGGPDLIRTPDRPRTRDLAQFPSPYLNGTFDHYDTSVWKAAVIETNRGCPYGCTFCDWGSATLQKISLFDLDRVRAELEWIAAHKIPILWIADANYGIFDRDIEIAGMIAEVKQKYGCPKQVVVNYAKNATRRLAEIIRAFSQSGIAAPGIISIQTTDDSTLKTIRRSNIKTKRYEELLEIFRTEKLPISTDLMIGLPGATFDSFKHDLQFFFDRRVLAKAYHTQVLPNSPMADPVYMKEHEIETNEQHYIVSTRTASRADMARMRRLNEAYAWSYAFSVLKYLLFYVQHDHGIKAMDYLARLADDLDAEPARFPQLTRLLQGFFKDSKTAEFWQAVYDEIAAYTCERYQLVADSGLRTVLAVQRHVMPALGRAFPESCQLEHDFTGYLAQLDDDASAPLTSFPPAELVITDPYNICEDAVFDPDRYYDVHAVQWELTSSLMVEDAVFHRQ